jgi:hypothetical protein
LPLEPLEKRPSFVLTTGSRSLTCTCQDVPRPSVLSMPPMYGHASYGHCRVVVGV